MSMLGRMFSFGRNEHYDKGIRLYDQGLFAEAIVELNQALAKNPDELTERLAFVLYRGKPCQSRRRGAGKPAVSRRPAGVRRGARDQPALCRPAFPVWPGGTRRL